MDEAFETQEAREGGESRRRTESLFSVVEKDKRLPCQTKPICGRAPGNGRADRVGEAPWGTDCAKQTRFGQSGPHHSTIPSFHRSNPMPIVRNKANWAGTRKKSGGTPNLRRADRAKEGQFPPIGSTRGIRNRPPSAGHSRKSRACSAGLNFLSRGDMIYGTHHGYPLQGGGRSFASWRGRVKGGFRPSPGR